MDYNSGLITVGRLVTIERARDTDQTPILKHEQRFSELSAFERRMLLKGLERKGLWYGDRHSQDLAFGRIQISDLLLLIGG